MNELSSFAAASTSTNTSTSLPCLMTLGDALAWVPGARLVGDPSTPVARVHTDSRSLQPGDLFVALRGERFDAHDFLPQAGAAGAVAAIAHQDLVAAGLPGLEVPDTLRALAALAHGWRRQFTPALIAVTGSNGKTTVTQMIASILRAAHGDASLATAGNFNNEVGVPLTLLRLRAAHVAAVVELGMNHPGEIAHLARMAEPTVALVNNAQREHQEFMGTVEAVAHENGAVIVALHEDGTAVFPADDAFTPLWRSMADGRSCITFGDLAGDADTSMRADVHLVDAEWLGEGWLVNAGTPSGALRFGLQVAGRHNIRNALAAAACALAIGTPLDHIAAGLGQFRPVTGRSRAGLLHIAGRPVTVVDDTYNANPDSVRAAIDILADLPAPRLLLLGDMAEVGNAGPAFHAEVGGYARQRGIDALFAIGPLCVAAVDAFNAAGEDSSVCATHFGDHEALDAAALKAVVGGAADVAALPVRSVLVKGSRSMKMERSVRALEALAQPLASTSSVATLAEARPCC